jgi:hypothetical protein
MPMAPYGRAMPYPPPPFGPYGYPHPYVVPPPRPPKRHSPLRWTLVVVSILLIVGSALVAVAQFALVPYPGEAVTWHAAGDVVAPPGTDASTA